MFPFEDFENYAALETSILHALDESYCIEGAKIVESKCDCILACNENTYESSTSASPWPHISRQLAFYESYIRKRKKGDKYTVDESIPKSYESIFNDWNKDFSKGGDNDAIKRIRYINGSRIEDNFLKINFLLDSPHPINLTESWEYTSASFLAELGGTFTFNFGISIMTFFEIFVLCLSVVLKWRDKEDKGK